VKTGSSLTLPDGRKVIYAEFGQRDGYSVRDFHAPPARSKAHL
jgi:hypothetical protein